MVCGCGDCRMAARRCAPNGGRARDDGFGCRDKYRRILPLKPKGRSQSGRLSAAAAAAICSDDNATTAHVENGAMNTVQSTRRSGGATARVQSDLKRVNGTASILEVVAKLLVLVLLLAWSVRHGLVKESRAGQPAGAGNEQQASVRNHS